MEPDDRTQLGRRIATSPPFPSTAAGISGRFDTIGPRKDRGRCSELGS